MNCLNIEQDFYTEIYETLEGCETAVLNLERGNKEDFKVLMRGLHSLKGTAGMLDLKAFEQFAHSLESFVQNNSINTESSKKEDFETVLSSLDQLKRYLDTGKENIINNPIHYVAVKPKVQSSQKSKRMNKKLNPISLTQMDIKDLIVYFVDDDPGILEIIQMKLERKGAKVSTFQTGAELKNAVINQGIPDVVLIDNKIGKESGLEIASGLNSLIPDLPKVIISGFVSSHAMKKALGYGVWDILDKPLDDNLLTKVLFRVQRKKMRDQYVKDSLEQLQTLQYKIDSGDFKGISKEKDQIQILINSKGFLKKIS